jgi:hypothetical protein
VKVSPGRAALGGLGLAVGVASVLALREATLSTHQPVPPGSTIEVRFQAGRGGAYRHTMVEMVEALVLACRLEVVSDLVGGVESIGQDRFLAVLAPSMDETNQRQFRGCMEDWTADHLQIDELSFSEVNSGDRRS